MVRKIRLRKLQFSLSALLLLTTIAALLAGLSQFLGERSVPVEERILGYWSGVLDIPNQPRFMSEGGAIHWGFYDENIAINFDNAWQEADRGKWKIIHSDEDELTIEWGQRTYLFMFDGNDRFSWKEPQMVYAMVFTRVGYTP